MKKGWEIKKLGDLYDITSSKRVFESDWKKSGVPFYRAREIVKLAKQGFVDNELFIDEAMYIKYAEKYGIPKEGDIMVTGVGTLGICYVVRKNDKFYFKDGNIIWLKRKGDINTRFVEYAFKSDLLRKQIDDSLGATVGTYTIIKAKSTLIPVPSPLEQQRIVNIIDEAFTAIAKAKENAEKNLQNARDLFESVKNKVFQKLGDIENKVPIESVCNEIFAGGDAPKKNFSIEKTEKYNIPIIANAVKDNGLYGFTDLSRVNKPSITIAARGSGTGHTEIRYESFFPIVRLIVLTPNIERITLEFLKFSIQNLDILSSGSAIPQLTIPMIKEYFIPLPSISVQRTIVSEFDALSAETKKLEAIYQQKLANLEELKKAILQKAFSGELKVSHLTEKV